MEPVDWKTYVDQRITDLEKLITQSVHAQERAISAALVQQEKAVDKALRAQETVNATQNEFRGAMKDREADFIPRKEIHAMIGTAFAFIMAAIAVITFLWNQSPKK